MTPMLMQKVNIKATIRLCQSQESVPVSANKINAKLM